ncbi:MAG: LarC family nickel insertion protein [Pseudomonadota bacterium]
MPRPDKPLIVFDPVGGVAGDMFCAALLDLNPERTDDVQRSLSALAMPPGTSATAVAYSDGVLTGRRFEVQGVGDMDGSHHDHGHDHNRRWADIRDLLQRSDLDPDTKQCALAMFALLAEAEAAIHGVAEEDVSFHEVGAWDSIIDIVAAATLIARLGPCDFEIGPVPRGKGLVRTQHGMLPLPAPATARLLTGFVTTDDGEAGERVTPTGAAILKYLRPAQTADQTPRRLAGTGCGFGTRKLSNRSNVLRASLYEPAETDTTLNGRSNRVDVISFEIDDQTGEDLAIGIDHIRAYDGVHDVCQWPVFGKKNRVAVHVQVLSDPAARAAVADLIFRETTTLGLRITDTVRRTLPRSHAERDGYAVKVANRPGGETSKVEASELTETATARARQAVRQSVSNVDVSPSDDDLEV